MGALPGFGLPEPGVAGWKQNCVFSGSQLASPSAALTMPSVSLETLVDISCWEFSTQDITSVIALLG